MILNFYKNLNLYEIRKFIIIFYLVGSIGFIIPYFSIIFSYLISFAIILSCILLAFRHEKFRARDIIIFSTIFILGYSIEAIGVYTGEIFGSYNYNYALGPKIFETPILIGVNWLLMIYLSTSVTQFFTKNRFLLLLIAPLIMVGYDFILEICAPKMNMWHWANDSVPIQNYIAWYCLALFFCFLISIFNIKTKNPLSIVILLCQIFFFSLIAIFM
jgi:putative membrane protein